jgi:hypothetical protein
MGRVDHWPMAEWTVDEVLKLARALVDVGDSFYVRRVLQRLESGDLSARTAIAVLQKAPADAEISIEVTTY